jgi:DNA polymerase-3 subunit gamma/tau
MIQVAQALDEDEAGCGRRPSKILKPLFAAIKKVVDEAAKPQASTPQSHAQPATNSYGTASATGTAPAVANTASASVHAAIKRMAPHSLSIKAKNRLQTPQVATEVAAQSQAEVVTEVRPFEYSDLSFWWYRYAMQLPIEENAVAGRLKNMRPVLMDGWRVEVPVENEQVMKYMNEHLPRLQNFLRKNLRNVEISLHFRMLKEAEIKRRAYSKREQLALMLEKSVGFRNLAKALKLELQ